MKKRNRASVILRDKTGASLVIVLGIMLLLMAVGFSVLVAAEAGAGTALSQREHNRLLILDDSIHQNIMYSLQNNPQDNGLMSYQLAMALYEAKDGGDCLPDIELGIEVGDVDLTGVESIALSFPTQNVVITPGIPAIPPTDAVYDEEGNMLAEADPGASRVPKTATVNASMVVTAVIGAEGKTVTSRAVYEYTGGMLSDEAVEGVMAFSAAGYGNWRLVKHEKVDS